MNKNPSSSRVALQKSPAQLSTVALESQVKDVLHSAKGKLSDLNRDIDKLTKENEVIQKQVDYAVQHKSELQEKNRQLNDGLRAQKKRNEDLARQKAEMAAQLRAVEDELRLLVERAEGQKAQILKEIM
jgi:chromosome segregation ATPase